MPRLRDIDRELVNWDESKHPRDRKGRFTFSIGSPVKKNIFFGRGDRIDELMKLQKKADKLGTDLVVDPKAQELYIPEFAVQGLSDAKHYGFPLPEIINIFDFAHDEQFPEAPHVAGRYWPGMDLVEFNQANPAWDDTEYGPAHKMAGWWAAATPLGVAHHELGHLAHEKNVGGGDFWDLRNDIPLSVEEKLHIGNNVSIYGATKPTEFVAEVISGHMNGEEYPSDIMTMYKAYGGPDLKD